MIAGKEGQPCPPNGSYNPWDKCVQVYVHDYLYSC